MILAGRFNRIIDVYNVQEVKTSKGTPVKTETLYRRIAANYNYVTGDENATNKIIVRYDTKINNQSIIKVDGTRHEITKIEVLGRREALRLHTKTINR